MFKAHGQRVRMDGREGGDWKYFHSAHFVTKEMSVWPVNKSSRGLLTCYDLRQSLSLCLSLN